MSHFTSVTYKRSHWTISLLIWWHRVKSIDCKRAGSPEVPAFWSDVAGVCARMCAVAANADADDVTTGGRCAAADADDDADEKPRGDELVDEIGREYARELGGRRDSTTERMASQSSVVQPSRLNVVSFGHTHVWETGGAARFCGHDRHSPTRTSNRGQYSHA